MSSTRLPPNVEYTSGKVKLEGKDFSLNSLTCLWEIEDFAEHNENCLKSPGFRAFSASGDTQWSLYLYPRGNELRTPCYLSLFLHANTNIKAVANFKILNKKKKVVVEKTIEEFVYGESLHGNPKLIQRSFIVDPLLKSSSVALTIVCEITVSAYEFREMHQDKDEVIDRYEALFNDSKYSDVCLISEGQSVKVHKCILAKSSPVFAAMFDTEMKETRENTVDIVDIKYNVLVEMARFIYAGKIKNISKLAITELAAAADKYALDELKKLCGIMMRNNLSVDNVFEYLYFADRHHMNELKKKTIEFMSENASDITEKPEFESLPSNILRRICRGMAKKRKLCCF